MPGSHRTTTSHTQAGRHWLPIVRRKPAMVIAGLASVLALLIVLMVGASMGSLHDRPTHAVAKEITTVIVKKDPPRPTPPPKIVTVVQNVPIPHRLSVSRTSSTPPPVTHEQEAAPSPTPSVQESEMPCPGYPQFTSEPADGCPSPTGGDD